MNKINYIFADATNPIGSGPRIIMQGVNTWNIMGAGFAQAVYTKWPKVKEKYHDWAKNDPKFGLGKVQLIDVETDMWVCNIVTQFGVFHKNNLTPIRYEAVREGLETLQQIAVNLNASVHGPMIGAGLARGNWAIIEQIIIDELIEKGIDVTIYQV